MADDDATSAAPAAAPARQKREDPYRPRPSLWKDGPKLFVTSKEGPGKAWNKATKEVKRLTKRGAAGDVAKVVELERQLAELVKEETERRKTDIVAGKPPWVFVTWQEVLAGATGRDR